jgi:peptidyl-prolyl cis-trans isomerase C
MPRLPSPAQCLRPALIALLLVAPFAVQAAQNTPPKPNAPAAAAPAANDPVVIKINGIDVHRSEIEALKESYGERAAKIPLEQFYQQVANRIVGSKLLEEAAKNAKLESDPDVKAELAKALSQIETSVFVHHLEAKAVTPDTMKAFYDKNVKNTPGKPELHARHILVASEDEAKAIIDELDKGGDFAKLADEKSTDKGGNGGDLGWFSKEQMVPEFSEAAFKLNKGEYTKAPVKSQFGWHVIKVEDSRTAPPPTFDEAKDQIRNELAHEAVEAKLKELETKAKIELFQIDGSPLPPPPPAANTPALVAPLAPSLPSGH